jgi:hypothetical protein
MRNERIIQVGLAVPASLLLRATCSGAAQATTQRSTPLSCEPKQISSRDTLVLRFRIPHPAELAIRVPRNVWYFLVYDPDKSTPQPIVDRSSFAKMSEMRLPVATARGVRWDVEHKTEVIFRNWERMKSS